MQETVTITSSEDVFNNKLRRDDYLTHTEFLTLDNKKTFIIRNTAKLSNAISNDLVSPFLTSFRAKSLKNRITNFSGYCFLCQITS